MYGYKTMGVILSSLCHNAMEMRPCTIFINEHVGVTRPLLKTIREKLIIFMGHFNRSRIEKYIMWGNTRQEMQSTVK